MTITDRPQLACWSLIGWTIVLWLSRLRNVLADDDLTAGGRLIRIGVVGVFVLLALAAIWGLRRGRSTPLVVLVGWTVIYWIVRGGDILIDSQWSVGFKAVHTALMAVSLALAAWAWRALGSVFPQDMSLRQAG